MTFPATVAARRYVAALVLLGIAPMLAASSPAFARSLAFRGGILPAWSAAAVTPEFAGPGGLRTDAWTGGGIPVSDGTAEQAIPAVIPSSGGHSIIAWLDRRDGNIDVYANRFDGNGNLAAGWSPSGVPLVATPADDYAIQAMIDGAGGVIVVYGGGNPEIPPVTGLYAKRFTSAGVLAPGWPADGVTLFAGDHLGGGAFADGFGGLYAGWVETDSTIRVTRFDGNGARVAGWPAAGVQVSPSHLEYMGVEAVVDASGALYVTWTTADGVYAQRVTGTGTLAAGWPAGGLHVYAGTLDDDDPSPALSGGDLIVGWTQVRTPGEQNLYAKRVTSAGVVDAGWPAAGVAICAATGDQDNLQATSDQMGGALFLWIDSRLGPGLTSLYTQRLTSAGAVATGWAGDGNPLCATDAYAASGAFFADGSGGLFAAWPQYSLSAGLGIQAQHIGPNGDPAWPDGGVAVATSAGAVVSGSLATDGAGGAIVAWADERTGTLRVYAGRVQSDGTVDALAALTNAEAEPGRVALEWFSPAGAGFTATLERAEAGAGYVAVAELTATATGRLAYVDRDVRPGRTYEYRLAVFDGGTIRHLGHATVLVPVEPAAAVEGFLPNPSAGAIRVAFTLPRPGAARLEVLDVAGRVRFAREVGALGAGRHVVTLDGAAPLPAGAYLLRLTLGGRTTSARGVVLR